MRASEAPRASIDAIHVGFSGRDGVGYYKVGYWTPVEVTISAGSQDVRGDLEVVVPDGDGVPTRVVERDVTAAAAKKSVRVYVKFGRPHAPISVVLRGAADGPVLAERTFSADEVPAAMGAKTKSGAANLILELGSAVEFGSAIRFNEEGDPEETAVVHLDDAAQWPDRSYGYDGVDLVVLTTGDSKVFQQAPTAAFDALDRWLRLGGRLLISVGKNGSELLGPGKPLQRFEPGTFDRTTNEGAQKLVTELENFAGTSEPLDVAESSGGARATLTSTLLQKPRGRIEASTDPSHPENAPLVIRAPTGFGETIFFAADLDLPPISRWKARPELLAALVGRRSAAAASGSGEPRGQGMQYGYDDLAGQLRASLDQFRGVELVPFWLVALLAAGYIALLFPLDYLLGARARAAQRREELRVAAAGGAAEAPDGGRRDPARDIDQKSAGPSAALPWIRFAAIVAGVVLAAVYLGAHMKGGQLERSEAAVFDYDLETGLARGTNWLGVYSPASQKYSIELHPIWQQPRKETTEARLSWLGLPGSGIGGMNAPPAELPQFTTAYNVSAVSPSVGPVPLATWTSKHFTGRWSGKVNSLIDADLRENADRQLMGVVKVSKAIGPSFKLTHCTLFHDRWAYAINSFSDAEPIDVERLEATTSETLLTNRHNIGEREQISPYDRGGLDTGRILQMMMFYKLAGGRKYTGLLNRYDHELDLTDQLPLGRAILVGYGPAAAEIIVDGQSSDDEAHSKNLTIYRFVIPVESAAGPSASAKPK